MGSRITRAVFKDQRSRPLDKTKAEEISNMATIFFSFIACLSFFLFGYLYRPYLKEHPSLYLPSLVLILATPKIPVASKTILLSLLLFLLVIVSKISGSPLFMLKGSVILSVVLFAALSNCDLAGYPSRQALLLWAQYQCLWLGLSLSLDVEKAKPLAGQGGEDSMLVQSLFSLIGMMAFTLASFGKNFVKRNLFHSNKAIDLKQQIPSALMTFLVALCSLSLKGMLVLSFSMKSLALFTSLGILIASRNLKIQNKTWVTVSTLLLSITSVAILSENEPSIIFILDIAKTIVLNLICFDSIRIWSRSMLTGTQKPNLTVFVYFTAAFLALLCHITSTLLTQSPTLLWLLAVGFYAIIVGWEHSQRRNYQQLP